MLRNFIFYLGYLYYLLLIKTIRARIFHGHILQEAWAKKQNLVFCAPHHFLLALFVAADAALLQRPVVAVLASLSKDGELIAKLLQKRRFDLIRGSSSRGGAKALLAMAKAGQKGQSLGLAFDGPKGPPLVPKRGVVGCARAVQGEIVFTYGFAYAHKWLSFLRPFRVASWDRFLVLVPFCQVDLFFERIPLPLDTPEQEILDYIERRSRFLYDDLYKSNVAKNG